MPRTGGAQRLEESLRSAYEMAEAQRSANLSVGRDNRAVEVWSGYHSNLRWQHSMRLRRFLNEMAGWENPNA